MTRLLKISSGIIAIAIIISVIAIPATFAVTYLNSSTSWESNDNPSNHKIRVVFSYSGGNGDWVRYYACAKSNTGNWSEVQGFSTSASSGPIYGNWVSADYYNPPYVVSLDGYALYDTPTK